MFVLRLPAKLADCIDLAVDAVTLGEYGLERRPVKAAEARDCERRRRAQAASVPAVTDLKRDGDRIAIIHEGRLDPAPRPRTSSDRPTRRVAA